jgi:hypothetical protein
MASGAALCLAAGADWGGGEDEQPVRKIADSITSSKYIQRVDLWYIWRPA